METLCHFVALILILTSLRMIDISSSMDEATAATIALEEVAASADAVDTTDAVSSTSVDSRLQASSPSSTLSSSSELSPDDEEHPPTDSCSICLQSMDDGDQWTAWDCPHVLHLDCLKELREHRQTDMRCPLCRAQQTQHSSPLPAGRNIRGSPAYDMLLERNSPLGWHKEHEDEVAPRVASIGGEGTDGGGSSNDGRGTGGLGAGPGRWQQLAVDTLRNIFALTVAGDTVESSDTDEEDEWTRQYEQGLGLGLGLGR